MEIIWVCRRVSSVLPQTFGRDPRGVVIGFGVTLVMQILHPFEGDGAAAIEDEALVADQLGPPVMLVALADQRQVATGLDFAADHSRKKPHTALLDTLSFRLPNLPTL
ncbi:hypothetical protein J2Y39_001580 [Pseudomonas sp. 2957]|nr:hypothetical protein [Pseudomonas sp. 2957]MDR6946982.1 hypothetical protein [Pseudomonas sp. 2957]